MDVVVPEEDSSSPNVNIVGTMVALSILAEGRVQGVGFRYWTARLARSFCIQGWVTNKPDGTVFLHAQGEDLKIDSFCEKLKEGPPGAIVRHLTIVKAAFDPGLDEFEIH